MFNHEDHILCPHGSCDDPESRGCCHCFLEKAQCIQRHEMDLMSEQETNFLPSGLTSLFKKDRLWKCMLSGEGDEVEK